MDTRLLMNFNKANNCGSVSVSRRRIPAGGLTRIHWHNYYEMEVVVSGKMIHHVNGADRELTRGCAYLLSFYDYHSLSIVEDMDIINISFSPESPDVRVAGFLEHSGKVITCKFSDEELLFFEGRVSLLEKELEDKKQMSDIMATSLLSEILIFTLRCANSDFERSMPMLIKKATAYIHANFRTDITLNSLSEHLFVSPGYLGKAMSRTLGKSFNEYLGDIRLKYACNLLESSNMSVSDISSASGFNSTTYFLYVFKKRFGTTPGEYKNNTKTMQEYGG